MQPDRGRGSRAARFSAQVLLGLALAMPAGLQAKDPAGSSDGIEVGRTSRALGLASAAEVERSATLQYAELIRKAAAQGALGAPDHPQVARLRRIGDRLVAQADRFNPRAGEWKWEVNLIGSRQVNAFCLRGG